jgi:hypothetical protein
MMVASTRARIAIIVCCLFLFVPILGIPLQNEAVLEQLHNHTLSKWPKPHSLFGSPVQYFSQARSWLADRAYPIIAASQLSNKVLYFVFQTSPQHRVTLGKDGFLFLNGSSEADVNAMFDTLCIKAHSGAVGEHLQNALASLAKFARERGIAVDVVIVPTTATLYGDYLPASVPPTYLSACRQRASGDSPLLRIPRQTGMNFLYPFSQMQAARNDEAFYPKGHWHASGMSLKVVRDAYLALLGVQDQVDDRLIRGTAPAEILECYGILADRPIYFLRNEHVRRDQDRLAVLVKEVSDLSPYPSFAANYYVNSSPVIPESALMVSDSFGDRASEVFAGAFKSIFQVASSLPNENLRELIERLSRLEGTSRLILLVQEGGVEQIVTWADALEH